MTSQKQIKANRKNAQKSTGPKTAEGKAAISKNAVKHGLFAEEAVISGENPADYEAYLESFLTDLKPVGAVETMLAERFVSLAWRLLRAQRMQNQAMEDYIENHVTNPLPRSTRVLTCQAQGIPLGDPRCTSGHLPLGRAAKNDWACCRVLERMFMYERRIELSMTRILHEFKKQQIIRQLEQQDIDQQQYARESSMSAGKDSNLKKQSQFTPDMMGATPFMEDGYGDLAAAGRAENKANLYPDQSPFDSLSPGELLRKSHNIPAKPTG